MGRRGDPGKDNGFDEFFDEYLRPVFRLARRLTGSVAEAEDVAIESLARAFLSWERVRELPHRRAWVMRVAINLVIGQARRRAPQATSPEAVPDLADDVALRITLRSALSRLPRRQREAVALRYLADLSERDVAAVMGVSVGAVKTHVSRGLDALRTVMRPELVEGESLGLQRR